MPTLPQSASKSAPICLHCQLSPVTKPGGKFCSHKCFTSHRTRPSSERFWQFVHKTESCWTWTGKKNPKGYGRFNKEPKSKSLIYAHRFSWELHFGTIHDDLCVLHRCDNPACVNPEHLFLGTLQENNADCYAKGRIARGEGSPAAKLTEEQVRCIRLYYAEGVPGSVLSRRYGVCQSHINSIVQRKRWKHVE